jgi:ABC-type bacteriocin/lantibiotic exporter with double-glycine peptidase domain
MKTFPLYRQHDQMDCGPTCLRMIAKHHGRHYSMDTLRQKSGINREGVSLLGISEAAEEVGFRTVGAKLTWEQLKKEATLPCVIYWNQVHFVVVYKIKGDKVYLADPAKGKVTYQKEEFLKQWLNNCEKQKRWEWEHLQARLFHFQVRNLALEQYQQGGAFFINEGKNNGITFISAIAVVNGQLTLGAMLAIQYIIGQLNSPVQQLIGFVQSTQDAIISMERLNEVHEKEDEEPSEKMYVYRLPASKDISFKGLNFTYPGAGNEPVLKDIDLTIPDGKVTAIVGMSGSGKTTLLKLLLKFYPPDSGEIRIGESNFVNLSPRVWRSTCGAVMQDGFIFSDSITRNIAVGDEVPDIQKLEHAVNMACIRQFCRVATTGV